MISTVHPPYDVRIFVKEAKTLVRAGFDVSVAMTVERETVVDGIRVLPLGKHGGPKWNRLARNVRALRLLSRKADVIHLHDPELLALGALARFMGRRVIYDVHEFYHRKFAEDDANAGWIRGYMKPIIARAYAWLEQILLPRISAVMVVTGEMEADYERFVPADRVVLVRNLPAITAGQIEAAQSCDPPLHGRYILQTGGVSLSRAFHIIVEAAELLRERGYDVPIVNLGDVYLSDYSVAEREELRRRAKRADVRMLGRVSYHELLRWLVHAYVGYVTLQSSTNHAKSLPTKLFEYLACGLPVVCSDVGEAAKIVRDRKVGLTAASDEPDKHARAIAKLLDDPLLRQACASASLTAARDFSFDEDGQRLVNLYRRLTTKSVGAA